MNKLYRVIDEGELIMIAPLWTIVEVFRLHGAVESRILQETLNGGTCQIHFNNKPTIVRTSGSVAITIAS